MDNNSKLAANIRSLRKIYGETQEKLAEILNVSKSSVSMFETQDRYIDIEYIEKIAKHYMIPVEELMYGDFSDIGKISIDETIFNQHINELFPILVCKAALENKHFKKAYEHQKGFYDAYKSLDSDWVEKACISMEEYIDAYEDEAIKTEVSANFLGLWTLFMGSIKIWPLVLQNRYATFTHIAEHNRIIRDYVNDINPDIEKVFQELIDEIDSDEEIKEFIIKCKSTLKHSEHNSDIADYYIALQYLFGIVDNDMGFEQNHCFGEELLCEYALLGNNWALAYLEVNKEIIKLVHKV